MDGLLRPVESSGWPETPMEWAVSARLSSLVARVAFRQHLTVVEADDLLQEMRYALLLRNPAISLSIAFVSGIATHKAVDIVREAIRARRILPEAPRVARDPELLPLLRSGISRLPVTLKRCSCLRLLGHTEAEISTRLRLSRKAVRLLESKSVQRLRGPVAAKSPTGALGAGRAPDSPAREEKRAKGAGSIDVLTEASISIAREVGR